LPVKISHGFINVKKDGNDDRCRNITKHAPMQQRMQFINSENDQHRNEYKYIKVDGKNRMVHIIKLFSPDVQ
jgi:hypothetical protein